MRVMKFNESKRDLITNLQSYLEGKLGIDIKFSVGADKLSYKFNKIYQGNMSIIPGVKYRLSVAMREGINGWFIISGQYKVNDIAEIQRLDLREDKASYALIYSPYQFLQLLKYTDQEYLDNLELMSNVNKYNL